MSFKSLVSVVSEQRQEIKQALALFPYFETWESDLIAECCRVSSVVEFPPDEIILVSDSGNSHEVYFILEGVCKMLQNLFVVIKEGSHQKKTFYKLYKPSPLKASNFKSETEGYVSRLLNQKQTKFENESRRETPNSGGNSNKLENNERNEENQNEVLLFQTEESNNITVGDEAKPEEQETSQIFTDKVQEEKTPETLNSESLTEPENKVEVADGTDSKKEITYEVDHHLKVLKECKKRREDMIRVFKNSIPSEKPKNATCFFIQVGFLLKGACFGLEKFDNENIILTASRVKCLKIPRGFLLQHSPCNIWDRICLFHSLHLPSKEKIFDRFKSDRKWIERRKKQTAEIIFLKDLPRCTSTNDVPYSIRLAEANDFLLI